MSGRPEVGDDNATLERRGLRLSAVGALGMAALGLGFAGWSGSAAVALDGLFSLVGFGVALISLRVANLVTRSADERFQFGYAVYEPLLNLVKGLLIGLLSLTAGLSAADSLLHGGREVSGELAAVYAVVAGVGCLTIALVQRRLADRTRSPLLRVDVRNWMIDSMMSGAVAVAFLLIVLLQESSYSRFAPYADPVVVLLLVALSAPIPFTIVRQSWREITGRAPESEVCGAMRRAARTVIEPEDGLDAHLRMLETGRWFYVQLYVVLDDGRAAMSVAEADALRERIYVALSKVRPDVCVDIAFTTDAAWLDGITGGLNRAGES